VLTAQAWLWSERGIVPGSTVRLMLRDVFGRLLGETTVSALGAIADPTAVADLTWPRSAVQGIVIWEAHWLGPYGEPIDLERAVASLGDDLGPLLDLDAVSLDVCVVEEGDVWNVELVHTAGPALLGAVLHDARPWGAEGSVIVRDDPRPLLPGESRELTVRWTRVPRSERALSLDAWNLKRVDLPASTVSTRG
jgi:hypothetical protein